MALAHAMGEPHPRTVRHSQRNHAAEASAVLWLTYAAGMAS